MQRVDENADNRVDLDEFLAIMGYSYSTHLQMKLSHILRRAEKEGMSLLAAFDTFDHDGDLSISVTELQEGLQVSEGYRGLG